MYGWYGVEKVILSKFCNDAYIINTSWKSANFIITTVSMRIIYRWDMQPLGREIYQGYPSAC